MTEDEVQSIRRQRLAAWLEVNGGPGAACRRKGLPKSVESHISQILGGYSFGARAARNLETKLGIQAGALEPDPRQIFTLDKAPQSGNSSVVGETSASQDNATIVIRQFDTGGSMGSGLVLQDQPGVIESWAVSQEWITKNVRSYSAAKNLCIVTGFGDSMRPMYNPGDPLLVDAGVKSVDFDAVYFFRVGDEGFVKRLQRIPGQGLAVISENPQYRDWTISPGMDFEVFGRVVKVWRGEEF
jgi:hypothetical protein